MYQGTQYKYLRNVGIDYSIQTILFLNSKWFWAIFLTKNFYIAQTSIKWHPLKYFFFHKDTAFIITTPPERTQRKERMNVMVLALN